MRGAVTAAINSWLASLVTSALNPILDLVGRTVLSTPDLTGQERVTELWRGSAVAANTAYVLLVLAGGVLVMTYQTVQTRYALREIAPRIVIGALAANISLELVGKAIEVTNALTQAVVGPGVDPASAAQTLTKVVTAALAGHSLYLILIGLGVAVLGITAALTYIVRIAVTVLLIAAAPLALACHAFPPIDGAARLWWRALAAVLAIQLGQGLVFAAALRVFLSGDGPTAVFGLPGGSALVSLLVSAALLYILIRIPVWALRAVFTGQSRSRTVGMLKTLLIYKTLGAVGVGRRRAPTASSTTGGAHTPTTGRGGSRTGRPAHRSRARGGVHSGGVHHHPARQGRSTSGGPGAPAPHQPTAGHGGPGGGGHADAPAGAPPSAATRATSSTGASAAVRAPGAGSARPPRAAATAPGAAAPRPAAGPVNPPRAPRGRQLALPLGLPPRPPSASARPAQLRLAIQIPRVPRTATPGTVPASTPPAPRPAPRAAPPPRVRQLRLPIEVARLARPARPRQLALPLDPPPTRTTPRTPTRRTSP